MRHKFTCSLKLMILRALITLWNNYVFILDIFQLSKRKSVMKWHGTFHFSSDMLKYMSAAMAQLFFLSTTARRS